MGYRPKYYEIHSRLEDMTVKERAHLQAVLESLESGSRVELNGNLGWVFRYLHDRIRSTDLNNPEELEGLRVKLIEVGSLYEHSELVPGYCDSWASECLLAMERYSDYLTHTEPEKYFGSDSHKSNLRLNIQRHLNLKPNPKDLLLVSGGRSSKFIKANGLAYLKCVEECFQEYERHIGPWLERFEGESKQKRRYPHYLFPGVRLNTMASAKIQLQAYYSNKQVIVDIREASKDAENRARTQLGLPEIGQGWISETELYNAVVARFPMVRIIQHGSPSWLGQQHFDVWIPSWKIAIEYNGLQHYEPVEFFGGEEAFKKTIERDQKKAKIAKKNDVKLLVVRDGYCVQKLFDDVIRACS